MTDSTDFEALIELVDSLSSMVVAACAGYRERCVEAGFGPDASEEMAVELHRKMLDKAFGR